jgi:hypothetical protein
MLPVQPSRCPGASQPFAYYKVLSLANMHVKSILLPALFAAIASAAATPKPPKPFACGTPEPTQEHIKISQKFAAQEKEAAAAGNFSIAATINVDVYFHVVASSTALSDGYVTVRKRPPDYFHFLQIC